MNSNANNKDYGFFIGELIVSLLVSLIINLSIQLNPLILQWGNKSINISFSLISISFLLRTIILSLFVFLFLTVIIKYLQGKNVYYNDTNIYGKPNIVFIRTFTICTISWGICFLVFYPGTGMNDTINGIISPFIAGNMQPFFYQAYVHYVFKIGQWLFNGNGAYSYSLLTIIQILFSAFCVAFNTKWLYEKRILGYVSSYLYGLFFCLYPTIVNYTITIVKDVPFSFSLLIIIPLFYDVANREMSRVKWALFSVGMLLFWFSRSNGKYVSIIAIVFILLAFRSYILELIVVLTMLILMDWTATAILSSHNPYDCSMREASGILLNQISAVIATDGIIAEEDALFINNILPHNQWGENYQMSFVDPLKFSPDFNNDYLQNNKVQFLRVWLRIFVRNPDTCCKAYLLQTYGLWSVMPNIPTDYSQSVFTNIHNNVTDESEQAIFLKEQNALNKDILPAKIAMTAKDIYIFLFRKSTNVSPGCFISFLLILLGVSMGLPTNIGKGISPLFLMDLMIFATEMIAVPGSFIYRYTFYLILTIPMLFAIVTKLYDHNVLVTE